MNLAADLKRRPPGRNRGFTLVEVLMAMGIAGFVFVTLYLGLAQCFGSVQSARYRLRATQILTEKLEVIHLYNWDQLNTPGFVPATFTESYRPVTNNLPGSSGILYSGTIIVTNAAVHDAYDATMRKVVAEVTWVSGGAPQRQRMETFVSQYGIQNYVY